MEWINDNIYLVGGAILVVVYLLYSKGYFNGSTSPVIGDGGNPSLNLYRRVKQATQRANEQESADALVDFLRTYKAQPDEIHIKVVPDATKV